MHFKDSYTNVSNWGGTLLFSEARGGRLFASCSNSNEVLSSNVDPLKTRPLSSSPGYCSEHPFCLLVPGLYLWPRLLAAALMSTWQLCWPLTNALPLCEGVHMASAEQDYLFLTFLKKNKKTIHNSFCAPIEREHELFLNSTHFDILLYLNGFVIWHCVLCILI